MGDHHGIIRVGAHEPSPATAMLRWSLLLHLLGMPAAALVKPVLPKAERPIARTKADAFARAFSRVDRLPSVLLVRTFDAGNIGSAARAMLNFGLCEMRLAAPLCDDHKSEEAVLRASGAAPLLEKATVFSSVEDATADVQLVLATTARTRDANVPVLSPREAAVQAAEAIGRGERVTFMFGSEKNGLSNEELRVAHAHVTIPTDPSFSSLNLAQAVLLLGYEWALAAVDLAPPAPRPELDARAPVEQLNSLIEFWEGALWECGFLGGGGRDAAESQEVARATATVDKLRRLVMRSQPSAGEVGLLRGALQALRTPKEARRRPAAAAGRDADDAERETDQP